MPWFYPNWAILTFLFLLWVNCRFKSPKHNTHTLACAHSYTCSLLCWCAMFECVYAGCVFVCLSPRMYTLCTVHRLVDSECRSSVFVFILQASQRKVIQCETVPKDTRSVRYSQHMCRVYWILLIVIVFFYCTTTTTATTTTTITKPNDTLLNLICVYKLLHFAYSSFAVLPFGICCLVKKNTE